LTGSDLTGRRTEAAGQSIFKKRIRIGQEWLSLFIETDVVVVHVPDRVLRDICQSLFGKPLIGVAVGTEDTAARQDLVIEGPLKSRPAVDDVAVHIVQDGPFGGVTVGKCRDDGQTVPAFSGS
jgi:hypothetical protein